MKNRENWAFYDAMPAGVFEEYSRATGLARAPELDLIAPLWQNVDSIIEIGAGYGRVIEGLLDRNYSGQIYAIERCPKLATKLREKYASKNVNVIEGDLKRIELPRANIGLWLWAGIFEFPIDEQSDLIRKVMGSVSTLILDTNLIGAKSNATKQFRGDYEITLDFGTLKGNVPTEEKIRKFAKDAGYELKRKILYTTETGRERVLYIISIS
ncbi:MAG: methyltransferase domain-containing protein [Nanoarchaeota archaeon]